MKLSEQLRIWIGDAKPEKEVKVWMDRLDRMESKIKSLKLELLGNRYSHISDLFAEDRITAEQFDEHVEKLNEMKFALDNSE